MIDAGVVQGRAVGRLNGVLSFSTVVNFNVAMGRELMMGGSGMVVLEKEFANVILHGEAICSLLIVPIQINSRKFGAGPIFCDSIMFLEDTTKVTGVAFTNIFNNKVIYY